MREKEVVLTKREARALFIYLCKVEEMAQNEGYDTTKHYTPQVQKAVGKLDSSISYLKE